MDLITKIILISTIIMIVSVLIVLTFDQYVFEKITNIATVIFLVSFATIIVGIMIKICLL